METKFKSKRLNEIFRDINANTTHSLKKSLIELQKLYDDYNIDKMQNLNDETNFDGEELFEFITKTRSYVESEIKNVNNSELKEIYYDILVKLFKFSKKDDSLISYQEMEDLSESIEIPNYETVDNAIICIIKNEHWKHLDIFIKNIANTKAIENQDEVNKLFFYTRNRLDRFFKRIITIKHKFFFGDQPYLEGEDAEDYRKKEKININSYIDYVRTVNKLENQIKVDKGGK